MKAGMKIDRLNYEEYFILYVDNELTTDERGMVEVFVQQYPDLQDELDTLLQLKLTPDQSVVFEDKEELFQFDANLTLENCEEWLLLYTDNELNAEQRSMVEQFAASHPEVQQSLSLFSQTRLVPEKIQFYDKTILYRQEEEEKSRPVIWWKWAAAAVLVVGTSALLVLDQQENTELPTVISEHTITQPENSIGKERTTPNNKITPVETEVAVKKDPVIETTIEQTVQGRENMEQKNSVARVDKVVKILPENQEQKIVPVKTEVPVSVAKKTNVPSEIKPVIITTDTPEILALQQNTNNRPVTTSDPVAYNTTETAVNPDIIYASEEPAKIGKLRGFLRKVTRTFEKKTNIDATDEDDRLLVGGLAIRL
jgi:hypothetical protein